MSCFLDRLVPFRCTLCDALMGECDCWTSCECGWSFPKGEECGNYRFHAAPYANTSRRSLAGLRRVHTDVTRTMRQSTTDTAPTNHPGRVIH